MGLSSVIQFASALAAISSICLFGLRGRKVYSRLPPSSTNQTALTECKDRADIGPQIDRQFPAFSTQSAAVRLQRAMNLTTSPWLQADQDS
jgi:hypothetical protein